MRRFAIGLATGVACAALAAGWLWAQPIVQNQLSGNECWNAGQGAGGPTVGFVCAYQTRSSWGYLLTAAATTGTVQLTAQQNAVIMPIQITTGPLTFNMPLAPTPVDGSIVAFCNTSNGAFATQVVTITATAPEVFATGATTTLTTLAARTCVKLIYTLSNTTWSQVQ
jgi:hypothetical protein